MTHTFKKATLQDKDLIFSWLEEAHVKEFWDNSKEHKGDIINFIEGRKTPSAYCDGKYVYWLASKEGIAYAMIMTIEETKDNDIGELKHSHLSKTGTTYGLDFMIGSKDFLGKGLGSITLKAFSEFFVKQVDVNARTLMIDPAKSNLRALSCFKKAGFEPVGDFIMGGGYSGKGIEHCLMIKVIKKS